jgi:hypothetical protein
MKDLMLFRFLMIARFTGREITELVFEGQMIDKRSEEMIFPFHPGFRTPYCQRGRNGLHEIHPLL